MDSKVSKKRFKVILFTFLCVWLTTGLPVIHIPKNVLVIEAEARGSRSRRVSSRPSSRRATRNVQRRHHHPRSADRRAARSVHRRHHRTRSGAYVYSLSPDCREERRSGKRYYDCDGVYYQPYYQGNNLVYREIENPR